MTNIKYFLLTFIFFNPFVLVSKQNFIISCSVDIVESEIKVNGFVGVKLFDSVALGAFHDGNNIHIKAVPWYDASFEKKSAALKGISTALPIIINRSFDLMNSEYRKIKKRCEEVQPVRIDRDAQVNSLLENADNFLDAAALGILDEQQKHVLAQELYWQLHEEKKNCRKEHMVKRLDIAIDNVALYRGIQ